MIRLTSGIAVLAATLGLAASSFAQTPAPPTKGPAMTPPPGAPHMGMQPGRSMNHSAVKPMSKEDSAKFNAAFKEVYPELKPEMGVKASAERMLKGVLRNSKQRGFDSLTVYEKTMSSIDTNADKKLIWEALAQTMSAEDVKSLATFLKTPAGEHFLKGEQAILHSRTDMFEREVGHNVMAIAGPMIPPDTNKMAQRMRRMPGAGNGFPMGHPMPNGGNGTPAPPKPQMEPAQKNEH